MHGRCVHMKWINLLSVPLLGSQLQAHVACMGIESKEFELLQECPIDPLALPDHQPDPMLVGIHPVRPSYQLRWSPVYRKPVLLPLHTSCPDPNRLLAWQLHEIVVGAHAVALAQSQVI